MYEYYLAIAAVAMAPHRCDAAGCGNRRGLALTMVLRICEISNDANPEE